MSELFTKDCKSKTTTLSLAFLHLSEYSNQKIKDATLTLYITVEELSKN